MAERQKGPRERRLLPFDLSAQISTGAVLSTAQGYASRKVTATTTLAAQLNAEDATATLDDNPGVGALIIVDPNSASLEETFKVSSVTPSGGDFVCAISPTAEQQHSLAATVNYEPGVSATLLDDDTPTPSGGIVRFMVEEGADGQTYRMSVLATCDNGEILEDEADVDVVEFTPTTSIEKQPGQMRDLSVDFSDWTDAFSTTLSSATAFVSREFTTSSTVNGTNNAGATTLNLNANPGVGALLSVNPSTATAEKVLVSAVVGSAPWGCTVSPLQFAHVNAEPVTIQPGVSARLLVSTTASIAGLTAVFRLRRGASEQDYRMVVVATLGDGQIVQKSLRILVEDV